MILTCKVVEDILPLYYDRVCSEESAALVEEHLKACPHCKQMLLDIRADMVMQETKVDDINLLKKLQKSYQKMRRGWLVAILCLLVLIPMAFLIGVWRLWPQSFSDLISINENAITGFSASAMVQQLEDGQTVTDMYSIGNTQQKNASKEIIEILTASSYRQDLRNLLPWDLEAVEGDKNYDGKTVMLVFYVGNQNDDYIHIQFLSRSVVAVSSGGDGGFRIYHPTNHGTIDALLEYLQIYGEKQ